MSIAPNGIYEQETGNLLVEFDTYIENTYHNSNGVAFEPLEDGSFSSDSKQNTPFVISITPIITVKDPSSNPAKPRVDQIKQILEDLVSSTTLVTVLLQPFVNNESDTSQYFQYGKYYTDLSLYSIDYQNTPDQLELRPVLLFQQIRLTDTEYTDTQNTANPDNSATANQGQVQPQTADPSWLERLRAAIFGP